VAFRVEVLYDIISAAKAYNEGRDSGIASRAIACQTAGSFIPGTFQAVINFNINALIN
jgi:hypothetical protein